MNQTQIKNSTAKEKNNIVHIVWFIVCFVIIGLLGTGCQKTDESPVLQTDSLVDIDGNVYKTVKIGNQWWMAENLQVTHYRDSSQILEIPYNSQSLSWDTTLTKGAWCEYGGTDNGTGLLYNWYAIADSRNIAPKGWHVATDDDWKQLESYLGMASSESVETGWRGTDQGNKLKPEDNSGWTTSGSKYSVWGTNQSGFTALAGSCRLYDGTWGNPGINYTGFWWTATAHADSTTRAWFRYLDYKKAGVFRYYVHKNYGMSIRCVKD